MTRVIGITGSRSLHPSQVASWWFDEFAGDDFKIFVGDAPGVDAWALAQFSDCQIFRRSGNAKGDFARRSIALVDSLAAIPGAVLVGFPDRATPPGLFPSPDSSKCFCGLGSGTWATMAYAAGLGIPVYFVGLATPFDRRYPWGVFHCPLNGYESVYTVNIKE